MIMEINKNKAAHKSNYKCYPKKPSVEFNDVTITNTPLPQASSTVEKKSIMQKKAGNDDLKNRQLRFDSFSTTHNDGESSLGIFDNVSCLLEESTQEDFRNKDVREREMARMLLQRCSQPVAPLYTSRNKENNLNSTNLSNVPYRKRISNASRIHNINDKNEDDVDYKSTSTRSISFEPNEIAARSSEKEHDSPEKINPFENFSINSNIAELMAQFNEEEFLSDSKAKNQLLADEISWKNQNPFPAEIPNSVDKERLEFSCFSGIIGDCELTINDSKISVGEFFKRKCGSTGQLMGPSLERPSIGLNVNSPQKQRKLRPLIDETLSTEASYQVQSKSKHDKMNTTRESSIMSLSSIAQALDNIETANPRQLIDKLINIEKQKKKQLRESAVLNGGDTYTLMPNKSSLQPPPNSCNSQEKPERDISQNNSSSNNVTLESRTLNVLNPKLQHLLSARIDDTFIDSPPKLPNDLSSESESVQKNYGSDHGASEQNSSNFLKPTRLLENSRKSSTPMIRDNNMALNVISLNNQSNFGVPLGNSALSEAMLSKDDTLTNSLSKTQQEIKGVTIGKKNQELHTCLVGIPREADLEISNESDRWILCSLQLNQIQGEKDNIELKLPPGEILIEPDSKKSFKIGVKIPKMSHVIIVNLEINCQDMVTKRDWAMKHYMIFVPEECNIGVYLPSDENVLDFKTIPEDTCKSVQVTFENRNSIDIPIFIQVLQEGPQLFSIGSCLNETLTSNCGEIVDSNNLLLKPKQSLNLNIDFKGMSLQSLGEKALRKGLYNAAAKIIISVYFKESEKYKIGDISLIGSIGICKLDILDTQFPIHLQPRVSKTITLINSGSIDVEATAEVVQSKENQTESRDFVICPNKISLNGGEKLSLQISYKPENNRTDKERRALIKISVENKVSFYPVVGERDIELSGDSISRSETPQHLRPMNSPTSPHSLQFNRSGNSGRHSPGSTVSASTAIPLRATHTSLVWGSVKPGKSDTKRFTIRNTSNNKLKLFANIYCKDQTFKFYKESQHIGSSTTLTLQGMESKTLSVIFAPNFTGATSGKITFQHYNPVRSVKDVSQLMKTIQLYGYGGVGKIEISKALKDTSGQMWLSLGKLNSEGILHARIKLHNTGDLTCFSKVKLIPRAVYPANFTSWHIEPTELLLGPNELQYINVQFRPRKDDLIPLQHTNVIHVGTLKITHGDEPTRLRIRRLYNKLKDGQFCDKSNDQVDEFKEVVYPICKAFPGEVIIPDLKVIQDSVQNLSDLCKEVTQREVKLTIEINADETLFMLQENMDESQTFYSLCSDTESHYGGESFLPVD